MPTQEHTFNSNLYTLQGNLNVPEMDGRRELIHHWNELNSPPGLISAPFLTFQDGDVRLVRVQEYQGRVTRRFPAGIAIKYRFIVHAREYSLNSEGEEAPFWRRHTWDVSQRVFLELASYMREIPRMNYLFRVTRQGRSLQTNYNIVFQEGPNSTPQ